MGFIKFGIEIFLFYKITGSTIKAIFCPDKDGFFYGEVIFPWASNDRSNCFSTQVDFFRQIYANESIESLISQIDQYYLKNLTELSLPFKNLTTEEAGRIIAAVVSQGASLLKLDLSGNRLYSLNKTLFTGMNELQLLNLSYSHLRKLVSSDFAYLSRLEELYLSGNELEEIDSNLFYSVPNLKTLAMSAANWSVFDENVFYQLYNLEFMDLSSGRNEQNFVSKNKGLFKNLKKLKSLYLGNSSLSVLDKDIFNGLYSLEILDLSKNSLLDLNSTYFGSLGNLVELYLDNNIELSLSLNLFSKMQQLKKLGLKNLGLNHTQLTYIISTLPKTLIYLNIIGNFIDFSVNDLVFPPYLNTLIIGSNSFIPSNISQEWMRNFPKTITSFSIQEAGIESIDPYTFRNFSQLMELDLSHNKLTFIYNYTFYALEALDTLILSFNEINDFDDEVFGKLPSLKRLHLDNNKLEEIYDITFSKLINLEILSLNGNYFKYINENSFLKLSKLQKLTLKNNLLRDLSSSLFAGLGELISLDISSNYIGDPTISVLTDDLPSQLTDLDISGNLLTDSALKLLAETTPCNGLISIEYSKNPGHTINLAWQLQGKALKSICDDHICHANLPFLPACFVEPYPSEYSSGMVLSSYSSALSVGHSTPLVSYIAFSMGALTLGFIGLNLVKAGLKSILSVCQTVMKPIQQHHQLLQSIPWCHLFKSNTRSSPSVQSKSEQWLTYSDSFRHT